MATGDLIEFGTLLMNGTKQLFPTRPWRTDTTPPGASAAGNIPHYVAGATVAFGNKDADSAYNIKCREVNIDGKKLLIPIANLLVNISHDDLNALGFVNGKEYVIDGKRVLARLMTGGSSIRSGSDNYSGGSPVNNEWDRIIVNEANLSGLPTPAASDLNTSADATDFNSAHNKTWNWFYVYSWVKETASVSTANRVLRGYYSARYFVWNTASHRNAISGFRPVFEVLDSAPLISSGTSSNIGNQTAPVKFNYSVTEPEGQLFGVVEKLNGTEIGRLSNVSTLTNREFAMTLAQWNGLALNAEHTITIEATDSANNTAVFTVKFTKTNSAPTAKIIEPTGDLANLAIVDSLKPVFVWSFNDTDPNDVQSAYQVIIEDTNGNVVHDSGKKAGAASYYSVPASALNWGTRYKWTVRVFDRYDVPSEYAFHQFFLPNRPPTATNLSPGSNDVNAPAGASISPLFTWTFEDLDLEAQASFELVIYNPDNTVKHSSSRIYQNVQQYQVPSNALTQGQAYYAVLKVWDPNGLSFTTEKAYFTTNATPTAPFLTAPNENSRVPLTPVFSGIVGSDAENDKQHFVIQLASDAAFTKDVLTFNSLSNRTGWQVNGFDIPAEGVDNTAQGQTVTYTPQVQLNANKTYYWRMAAVDATTSAIGTYSSVRKVRVGNRLEFTTASPISTGAVSARRLLVAMDYALPKDGAKPAAIQVLASNNAFDVSPVWEDATAQFLTMDYFEFQNAAKTAETYAVSLKVIIQANDSQGEIFIDALGLTFD